jgi:hypothetical protein
MEPCLSLGWGLTIRIFMMILEVFATITPSLSLDLGKKIKSFPAEENLSDRISGKSKFWICNGIILKSCWVFCFLS